MKTYTKQTTETKPRLVIQYDEDAESPRSWSNLGYFITVERNHNSPDRNETLYSIIKETGNIAQSQEEHVKMIKKEIKEQTGEKVLAIYPVVKYEHSAVSYYLGTKTGFDYSNNGFYIVTDESQKELGTEKKDFEKVIAQELETYTNWCNGEVYGFTLYDEKGEVDESCWGFYDIEDIREYLPAEWKDENLQDYFKH